MTTPDYNPFSNEHRSDPYPSYAELRKHAPVHRLEGPGFFLASRYAEVSEILKNTDLYSSNAMHRLMMSSMSGGAQNIDGDDSVVDPRAIKAMSRQISDGQIDPVEMLTTKSRKSS